MKKFVNYIFIILGATILAFGIYNVHYQSSIAEGGELGLELLLKHFFNISPSITGFTFDFVLLIIGIIFLKNKFALKAMLGTCTYAVMYHIFEMFPPVLPSMIDKPLLACLIGSVFVGIGSGLVVKMGGASGGDDTLALLINKLTKFSIGTCYFLFDFLIILISLSYIDISKIIYSFITAILSSFIIDRIQKIKL